MSVPLVEAIFTTGWGSNGILQVREGVPPGSTLVGMKFRDAHEIELAFLLPEGVIAPEVTEVKLAVAMLVATKREATRP